MFRIQIPKPCHEDWNAMTPTRQGAFCAACSKEVVDFTKMTDAEVQHYFLNRTTGKTCGRFKAEQVDRIRIYLPDNILLQKMAGWKKYLAIVMLAFSTMLFGCDTTAKRDAHTESTTKTITRDTTNNSNDTQTLGIITPEFADTALINIKGGLNVVQPPPQILTGEPAMVPDTVAPVMMGRPLLMGAPAMVDSAIKKPASDTSKCNDTGYY